MRRLKLVCAITIALGVACDETAVDEEHTRSDASLSPEQVALGGEGREAAPEALEVRRTQQALTSADIAAGRIYELSASVSPAGAGSVTVTSSSPAVDARCAANICAVSPRATVVLQATPATPDYRFVRWTNCGAGTSARLPITAPTASAVCQAEFADTRVLATDGTAYYVEGGSIIASTTAPASRCTGARCVTRVGATVRMEARTNTGYLFLGWTGCSRSTDTAINLVASATTQFCVANFTPIQVQLDGLGATTGGRVDASMRGSALVCPAGSCTLLRGDSVQVSAVASPSFRFTGWSRCTTGTTNPVTLTLTRHEICTANFEVTGPLVTFSVSPPGVAEVSGRVLGGTGSCNASSCTIPAGGFVELKTRSLGPFTFAGWSCAPSSGPTLTLRAVTSRTDCVARYLGLPL